MKNPITALRLDRSDRALIEAIARVEHCGKTEAVRHAVRAYAERLGVAPAPVDRQRARRTQQDVKP